MSKGRTTTVQEATIPAFQEQQMKELFSRARGVAQQPFVPYTGPMVAGFSPDQLRQFEATRGLFETGMQYDPLTGMQQLAQAETPSLLGADIGAYQSPYQQQVLDLAMQDIQRQADIARTGAQERAIRAGAFGGSRSAMLEAESQRPFVEQMARTSAGLRQAGFEQAQAAAERDIGREMAGRQFQAGLLGSLGAGQMQRLGLLGGIGTQQQALQGTDISRLGQLGALNQAQAQANLDAQREATRQATFLPQEQLDRFAGQVTGIMGGYPAQFQSTNVPNPTPLQTALGIGTTLAGLYLGRK